MASAEVKPGVQLWRLRGQADKCESTRVVGSAEAQGCGTPVDVEDEEIQTARLRGPWGRPKPRLPNSWGLRGRTINNSETTRAVKPEAEGIAVFRTL